MRGKGSEIENVWIAAAAIALCATVALWPLVHSEFVYYDDDVYVTDNGQVQRGLSRQSLMWALTATHAGNWHPLSWVSHILDWQWFGPNAGGHHATSLVLHVTNSALLLWLFYRMTHAVWASALTAALFALHPLHVESAAWIAERKDVLSTLFFLLTLLAYVRYTDRTTGRRYCAVVVLFLLGLMAKPMLVTLPAVLLLLDYWPLQRVNRSVSWRPEWKLLREKIPLFAISLLSSVVTFAVQRTGGAVQPLDTISVWSRFGNAAVSYVVYLYNTVWPTRLAVFYPHRGDTLTVGEVAGALLLLVAVTAGTLAAAGRRPYLAVGWFWYLGTLVPVIGLVQVGSQGLADRYTYIPLIGVFIAFSWTLADWTGRQHRWISAGAACVLLLALAVLSRTQASYWHNSDTLFRHAIDVVPNNHFAHNSLGFSLARNGELQQAFVQFQAALNAQPGNPMAHNNMGLLLARDGKLAEAVSHYRAALVSQPRYAEAHMNLGVALAHMNQLDEAIAHYRQALVLKPGYTDAQINLGIELARQGKTAEAAEYFRQAVRENPLSAEAHFNLARAYLASGDRGSALEELRLLQKLNPTLARQLEPYFSATQ